MQLLFIHSFHSFIISAVELVQLVFIKEAIIGLSYILHYILKEFGYDMSALMFILLKMACD